MLGQRVQRPLVKPPRGVPRDTAGQREAGSQTGSQGGIHAQEREVYGKHY